MAFSISTIQSMDDRYRKVFMPVIVTSEAIELELIDAIDCLGIAPVVLDEIEVVCSGKQARICRGLRVPERRGDNAW